MRMYVTDCMYELSNSSPALAQSTSNPAVDMLISCLTLDSRVYISQKNVATFISFKFLVFKWGNLAFHMRGVTQAEPEAEFSSLTSLLAHSRARCQLPENCSLEKPAVKTCTRIRGVYKCLRPVRVATYFCTVHTNRSGFSVQNLLHLTILSRRTFRWLPDFWKIYASLNYI